PSRINPRSLYPMSQPDPRTNEIVAKAQALLSKVQADLQASMDFYRDNDIDPRKLTSACEPHLGPAQKKTLADMLQEDADAIQREVDEASVPVREASGGPASRIRMRNSV